MSNRTKLGIAGSLAFIALVGLFVMTGNAGFSDAQSAASKTAAASDTLTPDEIKQAMEPRSLGKPSAPLKLVEFASLSCPHCAHFYQTTFPKFKTDYIDTGKVQYTYVDFPLNAPALTAAAISLCMPKDSYFNYVDYLFKTQTQWAMSDKMDTMLVQNAKLLGANGDNLEKCMKSNELKSQIVARMKEEGDKYGVESTPTFIINGDKNTLFSGAYDYDTFKLKIDNALMVKGKTTP